MCSKPILRQPDYKAPFFLATDALAYSIGAVLSQEGGTNPQTQKPTQHPITYYSSTFISAQGLWSEKYNLIQQACIEEVQCSQQLLWLKKYNFLQQLL